MERYSRLICASIRAWNNFQLHFCCVGVTTRNAEYTHPLHDEATQRMTDPDDFVMLVAIPNTIDSIEQLS